MIVNPNMALRTQLLEQHFLPKTDTIDMDIPLDPFFSPMDTFGYEIALPHTPLLGSHTECINSGINSRGDK